MDTKQLKPNSHAYKASQNGNQLPANTPEKRAQKVVSGKAKLKENTGRKLANTFVSEDANNVKNYILSEVVIPTIKKLVVDIIRDGVEMMVYGDTRGSSGRRSSGGDRVSYRSYYDDRRDDRRPPARQRSGFDYDDIEFESRRDAEAAVRQMDDLIRRYGLVRVGDLYDMADLTAPYTAHNFGWTDVSRAEVVRTYGGGYIIKMPRAIPLD